jgi:oxygen-dependent protoporphyrinogen oxidase
MEMMKKHIVIIGGGISGLATLHYLKQKYIHDNKHVELLLLEKNDHLGGTIRSISKEGCLFETGPNGFLDSKKRTLDLVKDLGLDNALVKADQQSKVRYLSVNNTLHQLPSSLKTFLSFKLLNPLEKFRILGEFFVPKKSDPAESVYDFGKRRLGEKFSKVFLDPMVSGIYGGDARSANLKSVFPKIYALEEEYGSLFKAMIMIRKAKKGSGSGMGAPAGELTSFQNGVAQLIEAAGTKYKESIRLDQDIKMISSQNDQYVIYSNDGQRYTADELFLCAPAYSAGPMIKDVSPRLSQELTKIHYAPIAVVGLVCPLEYFSKKPCGYGYLIPSSEEKEVLGVLFEGNIFPGRCREGQVYLRVMIGGARHPDILSKTREELVHLAVEEMDALLGKKGEGGGKGNPRELFFKPWPKAIPQYDLVYCEAKKAIEDELRNIPNLHLVANYLNGVSLNDCIESAFQGAQKSSVT